MSMTPRVVGILWCMETILPDALPDATTWLVERITPRFTGLVHCSLHRTLSATKIHIYIFTTSGCGTLYSMLQSIKWMKKNYYFKQM